VKLVLALAGDAAGYSERARSERSMLQSNVNTASASSPGVTSWLISRCDLTECAVCGHYDQYQGTNDNAFWHGGRTEIACNLLFNTVASPARLGSQLLTADGLTAWHS